jgi:hypothetical protein
MVKRNARQQREEFERAARAAGVDESPEAFERIFAALVPPKKAGDVAPKKAGPKK